jgi:ABC-type transporter Mla subunit MlaD
MVGALCGALTYQSMVLPGYVGVALTSRVDTGIAALGKRLDERDKQVGQVLNNVNQFVDDTYLDNYANVQSTTEILHTIAEILRTTQLEIMPQVKDLLAESKLLVGSMQKDLDRVTDDSSGVLQELQKTLANASTLIQTLEEEVKQNSSKAQDTAVQLARVLEDLDKLLADKNIAQTIENVQESTKSVDIMLRPLRAKAALLKTVLSKVFGMFKINVPF